MPRLPTLVKSFIETVHRVLKPFRYSESAINTLLSTYSMTEASLADLSDEESLRRILDWGHDIAFLAPTVALAREWAACRNAAYVYRFNETNPWDGPWKGRSTHILDVAYLLLNFTEKLSDAQIGVAKSFAGDFIKFVNGQQPWQPITASQEGVRVYGPSNENRTASHESGLFGGDTGRSDKLFIVLKETGITLDHMGKLWNTFLAGQ